MSYMDNIASDIGETITVNVVTVDSTNKWGHEETSTETHEVEGFAQIMNSQDDEVREGTFKDGDLMAFFDESVSYLSEGNRIVYKDRTYEIKEIINEPDVGGQSHYQVRAEVV